MADLDLSQLHPARRPSTAVAASSRDRRGRADHLSTPFQRAGDEVSLRLLYSFRQSESRPRWNNLAVSKAARWRRPLLGVARAMSIFQRSRLTTTVRAIGRSTRPATLPPFFARWQLAVDFIDMTTRRGEKSVREPDKLIWLRRPPTDFEINLHRGGRRSRARGGAGDVRPTPVAVIKGRSTSALIW